MIHLSFLVPDDFPPSMRASFIQLLTRATTGGSIDETVRALPDHEVAALGRDIVRLHHTLLAETR